MSRTNVASYEDSGSACGWRVYEFGQLGRKVCHFVFLFELI